MKFIEKLQLDSGETITHEPEDGRVTLKVRESDDGMYHSLSFTPEEARSVARWLLRLANQARTPLADRYLREEEEPRPDSSEEL